jgi:hypothetical protein
MRDQQFAASLLQAIAIVVPVWIGVSQLLLRELLSGEDSEERNQVTPKQVHQLYC